MNRKPIQPRIDRTPATLEGSAPKVVAQQRARLMTAAGLARRGGRCSVSAALRLSTSSRGGDGAPPSTGPLARRSGAMERRTRAYVLLEIIIALTVFAIVATGLASVLHSSLDSANLLRRQAAIRRGLESILVEAKAKPKREEMAMKYQDDALGVEFHSELQELKWVNRRRQPVKGLYILRAVATDLRLAKPLNNSAEVYVYRP